MPINHSAIVSAGVITISVAIAAAIAVYESPELRRMADELRRKIALAFHSFGDVLEPNSREPLFNRPEDAEGFLQSRGSVDPGVVADDETLQRQRQELMYWNAVRLEKEARELMERQRAEEQQRQKRSEILAKSPQPDHPPQPRRATTFDDILGSHHGADGGTVVYNTGASVSAHDAGLVHRRPPGSSTGLNSSVFSNPFGDEHQISDDQQASYSLMAPSRGEMPELELQRNTRSVQSASLVAEYTGSILYDDVPTPTRRSSVPTPQAPAPILEWSHPEEHSRVAAVSSAPSQGRLDSPAPSITVGNESSPGAVSGSQEAPRSPFASIQAWTQSQNSNPSFYSPIPVSPAAPLSEVSEPDVISHGDLTPTDTDSESLAGPGEDVSHEVESRGDNFGVMSESEGLPTPASWTEVGSVVSEDDSAVHT